MSIIIANAPPNEHRYPMTKSYSVENGRIIQDSDSYGYLGQTRSLINDAIFEEKVLENDILDSQHQYIGEVDINNNLIEANQNEIIVNGHANDTDGQLGNNEFGEKINSAMIILEDIPNDDLSSFGVVFGEAQGLDCKITYIESRKSQTSTKGSYDVLFRVESKALKRLNLFISNLKGKFATTKIVDGDKAEAEINAGEAKKIWIPKHISELDLCNHIMVKFEPELHCSHPGYADKEYRVRRAEIVKLAFAYKYCDGPIPRVNYTEAETNTWRSIYLKCKDLHRLHACAEYNRVFSQLENAGLFSPDFMPQLEDLSQFLKKTSGFQLRPAAGLLTARDFLASLAFRVFQATQYMRHTSAPWHTPEPDVIHEVLGHIPMLADPDFAQMSQEIGLASLGASDEEIVKLATLYWFTVEFGLCLENGALKAYGAGLMSSFGELEHSLSGKPQLLPFNPDKTAVQTYQDETYQDIYFTTESFKEAKEQLLKYTLKLARPYEIYYDPYTQSIVEAKDVQNIYCLSSRLESDTAKVMNALYKLGFNKQ